MGTTQVERKEKLREAQADACVGESFHSYANLDKHSLHGLSFSQQRHNQRNTDWSSSAARSFFAESPYLESFMEKEMQNVEIAAKTLEDVGNEFALFSKAADVFNKATRRLSFACNLQPPDNSDKASEDDVERKRQALGPDMTATLERMGMLLEKIANAQEEFHKAFHPSSVKPLHHGVLEESEMASFLKMEAESHTKISEDLFSEYLNAKEKRKRKTISRNSSFCSLNDKPSDASYHHDNSALGESLNSLDGSMIESCHSSSDDPVAIWMQSSSTSCTAEVTVERSPARRRNSLNLKFWASSSNDDAFDSDNDSVYSENDVHRHHQRRNSCGFAFTNLPFAMENDDEAEKEELIQSIKLKQRLHNIRIKQTTAELKRFQFFQTLVHARCERMLGVSQYIANFGRSIQSYTDTCSEILTEQIPTLDRNEELSEKLHLKHQMNDKRMWDEREGFLVDSLDNMMDASCQAEDELDDIMTSTKVMNVGFCSAGNTGERSREETEEEVKLWDLPTELVSCSRYLRETPPGVLIEGWLYTQEQTRSRWGSQLSWKRNWYIVRHDGIYCLMQNKKNARKENLVGEGESIVKVKISDVVLCTVREVSEDTSSSSSSSRPRFCFELVIANQKPILLQARGPKELKRWVDGIRSAVEDILVKGKTNSELNKGLGVKKRSNELRATVLKRGLSVFKLNCRFEDDMRGHGGKDDDDSDLVPVEEDDDDEFENDFSENHTTENRKLIKQVMHANPTCADCGKTDPDWVSLNLGVLMCLECSGVHRSLGVHVSQVRSLTLDSLSDIEASVLLALGNEHMNQIFERNAPPGKKPEIASTRKQREEWIRNKYVEKSFINLAPASNRAAKGRDKKICKLFHQAARKADAVNVVKYLVHGADVDWDNDGKSQRALLTCVDLMKQGNSRALVCAKLLVQNGATADGLDDRSRQMLGI